jgi:predicted SAM-dependent methyltransferase
MISRDSPLYQSLRWAYQPIKRSIRTVREWSALPRRNRVIGECLRSNGFKGLHIGCGTVKLHGWINTDVLGIPGIDFPVDILKPLPFPDSSLDAIYAGEVVEHIERRHVRPLLREACRVLKPGGVVRLTTPDLSSICEIYLGISKRATLEEHYTTWLEEEFSPHYWMNAMFRFWGHHWVWDFEALSEEIRSSGFIHVERMEPQSTKSGMPQLENLETRYGTPAPPHCWATSMILEATK